jgi:iron(II)-dependent oxidoreductase
LAEDNWIRFGEFELGKYPVTVAEYKVFVEDDGYANERWWKAGGFKTEAEPRNWAEQLEHPNRPVTEVNWYQAAAYCAWSRARLPTEAEWGLAAGGEKREYPWGDEKPDASRANFGNTGPGHATPIGLYPAGQTPEGLQDMAGSVWEWSVDWYEEGKSKALRGGSWSDVEDYLRSAGRSWDVPEDRYADIGFRLARDRFSRDSFLFG